jgi:hypothetical protein
MEEEFIEKMNTLNLDKKIIYCEACKQTIDSPENEVKNEENYYHKKCLKCVDCLKETDDPNLVDVLDINSVKFKDGNILCKKHFLEKRYSNLYFNPTLISQVAIPKFKEIKYKVMKNYISDIIPQICLHFPLSEQEAKIFIKNGGIEKVKNEIQLMLGDEFQVYVQSVEIGSVFAKFGILLKKGGKNIKKFFCGKKEEKTKIIEKSIELIRSSSFTSIKNPDAISFVNQTSYENNEQNKIKIKNYLNEQIKKEEDNESISSTTTMGSLGGIGSINDAEITEEECELIGNELEKILNDEEESLKEEIKVWEKTSELNEKFANELENDFRDSIFEFIRTGTVVINKEEFTKGYEFNKLNCKNCTTKFVYHGTKIDYSSSILTDNFLVGKDCWYGLGIYFTDQLEYARYYWNGWECINKIPKMNESFSLIASEIFYDKTKFKQIYDYDYYIKLKDFPKDEQIFGDYKNKTVQKYGVHFVEVEGKGTQVITQNKKILAIKNKNIIELSPKTFKGREYVVTYKEQILPTYGLTFQRTDYCIIWRDNHFPEGNVYSKELEEYRKFAKEMQNYNLYPAHSTLEALKLVWKKKYNKIILISNCGDKIIDEYEGKIFADKARKILGFNAFILFFGSWEGHLNWIKNYPNCLFTNTPKFYKKYILNYNEKGLNELKSEIEEFIHRIYKNYSDFKFQDFKDHLSFPLYEKFKNGGKYTDLDCSDYNDI